MNKKLKGVGRFLSSHKYLFSVILGVFILGFADENSFMQLARNRMQISEMQDQLDEYNKQYEADSRRLQELRDNPRNIVKIARERYFMKADDEDIFILSDEQLPEPQAETEQPDQPANETAK